MVYRADMNAPKGVRPSSSGVGPSTAGLAKVRPRRRARRVEWMEKRRELTPGECPCDLGAVPPWHQGWGSGDSYMTKFNPDPNSEEN